MKLNTKIHTFRTIALLLSLLSFSVTTSPAEAGQCPYPVADQTANDNPKANIRLISPLLTDANSIRRYDFESRFSGDCDWFGVGMRYNQVYVPFGLKTNLVFQATNPAGTPMGNTRVTLRANKGYSNSNAAVRVNGIKARPAPAFASDGANVSGTTDANGIVIFVIESPDDCTTYGGRLPSAPTRLDSDTPYDVYADPTTDCFSQFLPSITGEKTDSADFVELHYFNPAALDYTASDANISLLAPTLRIANTGSGQANAFEENGRTATYSLVGSKQIVAFQAIKANGDYAMNQAVTVRINLANSGATAKTAAGLFANNGLAMLADADATKSTEDQLTLSGTTDSFGVVAFTLNNMDTTAGAAPTTPTTAPPEGSKYARIFAGITGRVNSGTEVEFHYYNPFDLPSKPKSLQIYNLPGDGPGFVRVKISHDYKQYEGDLRFIVYRADTGETICEVNAKSSLLGCLSSSVQYGGTYQFGVYGVNQLGQGSSVLSNIYEYKICSRGKPSLSGAFTKDALTSGSIVSFSGRWQNVCTTPANFVEYREKTWNKAWSSWIAVPLLPGAKFTLSKSFDVNTTVQFRGLLDSKHYLSPSIPVRVITKISRPISFVAAQNSPETKTNLGRAVAISFNGDDIYSGVCTATLSTARASDLTGKTRGSEIKTGTFIVSAGRGSVQVPLKWVGSYNLSVACRNPDFQDLREFAVVNVK